MSREITFYSSCISYERERRLRVALIYGMARMAAIMASTYRPYLGVGLGPFSNFSVSILRLNQLNCYFCSSKLSGRPLSCRLTDKCSSERRRYQVPPNFPVRIRPSDVIELGGDKKVF
ncbi:hypothetical protein BHM03_00024701 [Ensete ventricosum]|nr:hypothetical protein BHM03_00024701 [Ensete ventricosum]